MGPGPVDPLNSGSTASALEKTIKRSLTPSDVFRQDAADRADVAIVLGSADAELLRHRTTAAVTLFNSRRVTRLILCGDGRQKHAEGRSEADRMREIAVKAGVPATAIVLDDTSPDAVGNARECSRLLKTDDRLASTRSAFLVSSAWHLQRLFIIMRRHLPHQLSLYCHPAAEGITAANWQSHPQGRAIVDNELRLIAKLLKTGYSLR